MSKLAKIRWKPAGCWSRPGNFMSTNCTPARSVLSVRSRTTLHSPERPSGYHRSDRQGVAGRGSNGGSRRRCALRRAGLGVPVLRRQLQRRRDGKEGRSTAGDEERLGPCLLHTSASGFAPNSVKGAPHSIEAARTVEVASPQSGLELVDRVPTCRSRPHFGRTRCPAGGIQPAVVSCNRPY